MFRYLTVTITAADIAQGRRGSRGQCVFALALHRSGEPRAVVYYEHWRTNDLFGRWYELTAEAQTFVRDSDFSEHPVTPTTVRLPVTD